MLFLAPILKLAAVVLAKAAGEKLGEEIAELVVTKVAGDCPKKLAAVAEKAKAKQDAAKKAKDL